MHPMKYLVVIEKNDAGYGAYVPDLPGSVAVGESRERVRSALGALGPTYATAGKTWVRSATSDDDPDAEDW